MKFSTYSKAMVASLLFCFIVFVSCKKETGSAIAPGSPSQTSATKEHGHLKQTKTSSSEVAQKWQELQLQMLWVPEGKPNPYGLNGNRWFAYTGIALYEAVVPGMPAYQSLSGQLIDMPQMPTTEPGKAYHWPTSANAALAFMNKSFYTNIAFKPAMDALEETLNTQYQQEISSDEFQRSQNFGIEVARRIFEWSKTDGALTSYPAYAPPVGLGIWSPTTPNPTAIASPYWGRNRLFVEGSLDNTSSPPPPPYSTDPSSAYYKMVKEVYDISQSLTPEQRATGLYFNDIPGYQAGTHYISIFSQVMHTENPTLDFYALAHAKTGIALASAQIGCWQIKYNLLVERPIRYIRDILGHPSWNTLIPTHPHPEFPSGHSQTGGAFAAAMTNIFGPDYHFTLHTYDNQGMAPRPYNSFFEMAEDVGRSRVYGGIHYSYTCTESLKQGSKIVANILNTLKFKKD
jgi:hypothetical protein